MTWNDIVQGLKGYMEYLLNRNTEIEVSTGFKLKPEPEPYPRSSDPTLAERHSSFFHNE